MRIYADTSFIVRLIRTESDSSAVIAEFRRLGRPQLFFAPLHQLEVRNAILQRSFHQRTAKSSDERQHATRERDAALRLLDGYLKRGTFREVKIDADVVYARAVNLSVAHTERSGARSLDLLHVANSLELQVELFLTCDSRQAKIAKAEGLNVRSFS
jgi:predicted nucleic acid-binding protein